MTFGKIAKFLIDNGFPFSATVDNSFEQILESTEEAPAEIFNTWGLEFDEETIVPFCRLDAFYFNFTTEQERDTFINLINVVLNQTLSCCHSCGTCDICEDILPVDEFGSIIDVPENCAFEYYLSGECSCNDSNCDIIAKKIDLCNFANSTGEKLRGIVEKKQLEGKAISTISTQKNNLIGEELIKTIEATGLSSVLVSYEEEGEFKLALVCLNDVTIISFEDII